MKCKEIPHKHRFLFYHLQHRNNSSSHQKGCIYNRWREHLSWTVAAMLGIFFLNFILFIYIFLIMVIYLKWWNRICEWLWCVGLLQHWGGAALLVLNLVTSGEQQWNCLFLTADSPTAGPWFHVTLSISAVLSGAIMLWHQRFSDRAVVG